jgi:hypothetical protein
VILLILLLLCCLGFCFVRRRKPEKSKGEAYSIERENPAYGSSQGDAAGRMGAGMLGNDMYQGIGFGGSSGVVANETYETTHPTYADVAPNPTSTDSHGGVVGNPTYSPEQTGGVEPTYGTALPIARSRPGAVANATYADTPDSSLVRSGTIASTLSHTEFRSPQLRPEAPATPNSRPVPVAAPRKPSVKIPPPAPPRQAAEPDHTKTPSGARPGFPPPDSPIYATAPVALSSPPESLYNEPAVGETPPAALPTAPAYGVATQFGGGPSATSPPTEHYAASSPMYLENDASAPSYMQAAPVDGEYMASDGPDADTLPRKKPSLAERRLGSGSTTGVPSSFALPGGLVHFDEDDMAMTPRGVGTGPKSPSAVSRSSVI